MRYWAQAALMISTGAPRDSISRGEINRLAHQVMERSLSFMLQVILRETNEADFMDLLREQAAWVLERWEESKFV
jgi:hypothetical protein